MSFRRHLLKRMKGEKELPYIQLDYIESTGTQSIDTNLPCNGNYRWEITLQPTKGATSNSWLMGAIEQAGSSYKRFHPSNSTSTNGKWWVGGRDSTYTTIPLNYKFDIIIGNRGGTIVEININGDIQTLPSENITNLTFWLFQRNSNVDTYRSFGNYRLYKFKVIDENDKVVMDLIPCIRKSDGVVCMYDNISHSFFDNQGTGLFIPGTLTHLPLYYAQLDYLEGSGTQYFNTGKVLDMNTGMEIDFELPTTAGVNGSQYVMGARRASGTKIYGFSGSTSNTLNTVIWQNSANITVISKRVLNERHTMANMVSGAYLDGAFKGAMTRDPIDNPGITVMLFAFNSSNIHKGMRCYSAKIFDGETLERLYIPMLDPDKIPCMYDIMNDEVIYNAGSGTFTYGKVVKRETLPKGYQECEYLQAVNGNYIFIPVTIKSSDVFRMKVKPLANNASFVMGITYGSYTSGVQLRYQSGGFQGRWGNNAWTNYKTVPINEIYEIVYKNGEIVINGEVIPFTKATTNIEGSGDLGIFARQYSGKPDFNIGEMQIMSFQMNNDINLVPALDPFGNPCMYDTVSYKSFYNEGIDEFLYKIKEV